MWPIFAQGGDYGPKYDMLEANGDLDIDENDFEKRSAAEIFVDSLTKKGWYFYIPNKCFDAYEVKVNKDIFSIRKR